MESPRGFQFTILNEIAKSSKDTNVLISPVSIFLAMSLAAHGAKGQTLEEMLTALNYHQSLEDLTTSSIKIMSALSLTEAIKVANAIFTKVKPTEEYVQSSKDFDAMIDKLGSVHQINDWCSKKTNGKIKKIMDSITNIDMIILNAVYFLGTWSVGFNPKMTKDLPFINSKGEKKNIPMMKGSFKSVMYYKDNISQMVRLNYKEKDMSAIVILPNSIETYMEGLDQNIINDTISKMHSQDVDLTLPKFKIEYSANLNKTLSVLGIQNAFTSDADFSTINKESKLFINEVIHKTFINIDEKGTEVAAVTAVKLMKKSLMSHNIPAAQMIVDRPFFFLIQSSNIQRLFLFTSLVNSI